MYILPPQIAYIDIHTHHTKTEQDVFVLRNKYRDFRETESGQYYSMGLHPWYLANTVEQWPLLEQQAPLSHVLAIGECGLDVLSATAMPLQQQVFRQQIQLANTLRKPLVIHCVKAFPETLKLLEEARVPVIFHGFEKKLALALEITGKGYYLSFGPSLQRYPEGKDSVLAHIPANRFFLETDDVQDDIRLIYKAAATMRKTTEEVIILQLQQNFKEVFGI